MLATISPITIFEIRDCEGSPVRCTTIDGRPWLLGADLASPLGVNRTSLNEQIAALEPSDVRSVTIATNRGSRPANIVSESGAYQLIQQSRKPVGKRLRKWLADLGVAYSRGELTGYVTAAQLDAKLSGITQQIETLTSITANLATALAGKTEQDSKRDDAITALADLMGNSRMVSYDAKSPKSLLPRLTKQAKARLAADGFIRVAPYLLKVTGEKPTRKAIDSLAQLTRLHCEAKGCTILRFLERGRPCNFYPYVHIDAVHQAKPAVDADGQGQLEFAEVIDINSRRRRGA